MDKIAHCSVVLISFSSVINYGVLIYRATTQNILKPINVMQRRIIRTIFRKRARDNVDSFFERLHLSTVEEMHIYQVVKNLSSKIRHGTFSTNSAPDRRVTRATTRLEGSLPFHRTEIWRKSVSCHMMKLYNALLCYDINLVTHFQGLSKVQCTMCSKRLRDACIYNNRELCNIIFD